MTAPTLHFADAREAVALAAFLARLIHYDRAAAVRLQVSVPGSAPDAGGVLAVFGRPASFEVLAIRTAMLTSTASTASAAPRPLPGALAADAVALDAASEAGAEGAPVPVVGVMRELDITVSAGQFADALDAARQRAGAVPNEGEPVGLTVVVPEPVTGPPWAGVLPPRGGWRRVPGLPGDAAVRDAVAAAVAEFRARDETLPEEQRTRAERDRIGHEIWSRTVGPTQLPLRAVHAAQAVGFLRPARSDERSPAAAGDSPPVGSSAVDHAGRPEAMGAASPVTRSAAGSAGGAAADAAQGGGPAAGAVGTAGTAGIGEQPSLVLFAARGWLRLRTPHGSIAVRTAGMPALSVTPT
ncbi:hypothetical protein [Streptomyces zagrosensis]|uniref:Uncharacterized protein n=1 Tax=Streptomyces zagrosensis TaxID=1042984 RepID=A0A7W9Q876_9ACTN|nr:hypothetical protein [Streptomyces zagrosensis]MBB5934993.1 hypothetical protein [Streptomyces zagrosensis]